MIEAVQTVLADDATRNAVGFVVGSIVGIPVNWIVKWANKEVDCLWDMARIQPRRTVLSIMSNFALVTVAVATGTIPDKFVVAVAGGLLLTGFTDSFLNKAKRREWTDDERTLNQRKK